MALIKCPECGKEISDKAKTCIGCGFPLESYMYREKQKEKGAFINRTSKLYVL